MIKIEEYTIMRINNYDINCDEYINDIYSIFYKGIEFKKTGKAVVIEIISRTNLTLDLTNIKNIMFNQDKIDVIYKILDVFECEQNLYIVWEDFMSVNKDKINEDKINEDKINEDFIDKTFKLLQKIFIFVVDNGLLIDSIKYEDINCDKIMIKPQKKRKTIVYGSPIYSPHHRLINNSQTNNNLIDENLIINISILMHDMIIKRLNSDFLYSDFLTFLNSNVDIKTKSNYIRNIQDIKNNNSKPNKKILDIDIDIDIFHLEL